MKVNEILSESTAPSLDYKFPIAMKAVESNTSSARYATKFKADIEIIKAAFAAGEIINTQVQPIKDHINYFVKAAFDNSISYDEVRSKNADERSTPEFDELYGAMSVWDLRGMVASYKRLQKVSKESKATKVYKDAMALCEELMSLTKVMDHIKAITVKASVKKAEAKAARNEETETYNKKFTDHKDVKKVVAILKQTATDIEQRLYEAQLKNLVRIADDYKAKIKDGGESDYTILYKSSPYSKLVIQGIVKRVGKTGYYDPKVFELEKDYMAKLEAQAKRTAAEIVDHFVYKNSGKLSYVLYNKNNLKSVEIKNVTLGKGAVECDVVCSFQDGSGFTANSSVVYAVSKLGKFFYRYPTLFRGVTLPDGSKLSGATEQKMDEVFAVTK
jgi:hypothetical protein